MNRLFSTLCCFIFISLAYPAFANTFLSPVYNPFNLYQGDLRTRCIKFADIDGDDDLDLISIRMEIDDDFGDQTISLIVQENTGSATAPSFGPIVQNPQNIFNNFTQPEPYSPTCFFDVIDIDGDDDLDIVVILNIGLSTFTCKNDLFLFRNSGSATAPDFTNAPEKNPFSIALPNNYISLFPVLKDMDGDNDLDLLILGREEDNNLENYDRKFLYFENTGTAQNPSFGAMQQNPFGLTVPTISGFSVSVEDMDKDGDLDILLYATVFGGPNGTGETYIMYQNNGNATTPSFSAPIYNPFSLVPVSSDADTVFSVSTLADLDNDDDVDAILYVVLDFTEPDVFLYQENDGITGIPNTTFQNPINIYPNPANHTLHISGELTPGDALYWVDMKGSIISRGNISEDLTISTKHIPNGHYLLYIENSKNQHQKINHQVIIAK